MQSDKASQIQTMATIAQVLSIAVAAVVSVLSYTSARRFEASQPFLTLRQRLYAEAIKEAGVLANPNDHTELEKAAAKKRFRELYVAELSMVENKKVETSMVHVASVIDPDLLYLTEPQRAVLNLANDLRVSFTMAWHVSD